jgi:hypothetical protein
LLGSILYPFASAVGGHFKKKRHNMTNTATPSEVQLRQFTGFEN